MSGLVQMKSLELCLAYWSTVCFRYALGLGFLTCKTQLREGLDPHGPSCPAVLWL